MKFARSSSSFAVAVCSSTGRSKRNNSFATGGLWNSIRGTAMSDGSSVPLSIGHSSNAQAAVDLLSGLASIGVSLLR